MNCPKCGAKQIDTREFECGTKTYGHIRGEECYEAEIEKLRKRVAFAEKWREVVLKNVFVDWSDYDPRHWAVDLECDKSIPLLNVGDNPAEAFDAAVRKEME